MKKISTLNMKSGRSGKCSKKSTLNVKKSLVSWMTSQMVSLDNLVGLVNFFRHLRVSGCQRVLRTKYHGLHYGDILVLVSLQSLKKRRDSIFKA